MLHNFEHQGVAERWVTPTTREKWWNLIKVLLLITSLTLWLKMSVQILSCNFSILCFDMFWTCRNTNPEQADQLWCFGTMNHFNIAVSCSSTSWLNQSFFHEAPFMASAERMWAGVQLHHKVSITALLTTCSLDFQKALACQRQAQDASSSIPIFLHIYPQRQRISTDIQELE